MIGISRRARGCVGLTVLLFACGDDPTPRLAGAIDQLCELDAQCQGEYDERCVDALWRAAALYDHMWGEACVDAMLLNFECSIERGCDYATPELWCEDGSTWCEWRLPCDDEQAAVEAACGE